MTIVSLESLRSQLTTDPLMQSEYQTEGHLNLYDSAACTTLATQARAGRYLRFQAQIADEFNSPTALAVCLCEDNYPGWITMADLAHIRPASVPYQPITLTPAQIQARIPGVIAFAQTAMTEPNVYLWGGTIGPHYDCSGLMQRAFGHPGIWLPRDAYQQEPFVMPIPNPGQTPEDWTTAAQPGDLIFFGSSAKADHVALYLGEGQYIHSSGIEHGRNGIGIDVLAAGGDRVSRYYYERVRLIGRVVQSYQPSQPCDPVP